MLRFLERVRYFLCLGLWRIISKLHLAKWLKVVKLVRRALILKINYSFLLVSFHFQFSNLLLFFQNNLSTLVFIKSHAWVFPLLLHTDLFTHFYLQSFYQSKNSLNFFKTHLLKHWFSHIQFYQMFPSFLIRSHLINFLIFHLIFNFDYLVVPNNLKTYLNLLFLVTTNFLTTFRWKF